MADKDTIEARLRHDAAVRELVFGGIVQELPFNEVALHKSAHTTLGMSIIEFAQRCNISAYAANRILHPRFYAHKEGYLVVVLELQEGLSFDGMEIESIVVDIPAGCWDVIKTVEH